MKCELCGKDKKGVIVTFEGIGICYECHYEVKKRNEDTF